ncbi:AAA family ATPase [Embleya sp. NPDC020630]|uniref:bifunctional aminoglycoside phosphotransferase/ATP-binding protein n=1 Tax=Embleya sp. NPDC020630 TaxID=3363979 RepID=UPI00379F5C8A
MAVVYFAGDRAVKLKKPVDLGFLDFSTLEARRKACRNEVALNQRFAPDVYLGVGDVREENGDVVDHLVLMRRMPSNRRLSRLIREQASVDVVLRDVARMLAVWHARAPRGPRIDWQGSRDALLGRWTDSFEQVRALPPSITNRVSRAVEEIEQLTSDYLSGREELFAGRIDDGRIVDGHGDLIADDIFCLDDGPRVLDCLEFDDALRSLDGLDDATFLAMDLERLGAPALAEKFLHWYVEFSGDPAPTSLWHHYVAYRAFVRAKVALLRCAQGDARCAPLAEELTDLTLRHLYAGAVRLVLVGGLPGTGKTTIAGGIADSLGMTVLSTDRLRKESVGRGPNEVADPSMYAPDRIAANYDALLARARRLLALGESVVLDATWNAAETRSEALGLAHETGAALTQIRCTASESVTARRLASRGGGWSDADASVARALARSHAPWKDAEVLHTETPIDDCLARALGLVHPKATAQVFRRRSLIEPN